MQNLKQNKPKISENVCKIIYFRLKTWHKTNKNAFFFQEHYTKKNKNLQVFFVLSTLKNYWLQQSSELFTQHSLSGGQDGTNSTQVPVFSPSWRPDQISHNEFPDVVTRYAIVLLKLNVQNKNYNSTLTGLKSTRVETVGPGFLGLMWVFSPTLPLSWKVWMQPVPPLHQSPEKTKRAEG